MMKRISMLLAVCCLLAVCAMPACALEYSFGALDDYLFGTPTSDNTIYVTTGEAANTDRSKNAAFIPPAFGSPSSYVPNCGEYLTPNLVGGHTSGYGSAGNGSTGGTAAIPPAVSDDTAAVPPSASDDGITMPPAVSGGVSGGNYQGGARYTEVTQSSYYSNGSLGRLVIPALGLDVRVYQGTGNATLAKGAGHFPDTSIWDGNVCIAGHNRGVNCYFGNIHTLRAGDTISLTTKYGTRTYAVVSVSKVLETDLSGLDTSDTNMVTLYTCVANQSAYRWCVKAIEA